MKLKKKKQKAVPPTKDYLKVFNDKGIVSILNTYLKDKHPYKLPGSDRLRRGVINKVTSLVIMLFKYGEQKLINRINLPDYVKPGIEEIISESENKKLTIRGMIEFYDIREHQYESARQRVIKELNEILNMRKT
jgi:hypothetical protein